MTHPHLHLLSAQDFSASQIQQWFALARTYCQRPHRTPELLRHHTIAFLFQEPSTRTLASFVQASHQLGGHPFVLPWDKSSSCKGESLSDTAQNLAAMGMSFLVLRHAQAGMAHAVADAVGSSMSVINAGDGSDNHPTQALLDAFTLQEHLKEPQHAKIVILGDLKHSRVARSFVQVAQTLGWNNLHALAPSHLKPEDHPSWAVHFHETMAEALQGASAVMALRLQRERFDPTLHVDAEAFQAAYGLTLPLLQNTVLVLF